MKKDKIKALLGYQKELKRLEKSLPPHILKQWKQFIGASSEKRH